MNSYSAGQQPGPPPHRPAERISWGLVLGLGAVALARPLASITGIAEAIGRPAAPLLLTATITAIWVLAVGLGRAPRPVLTLTLAGVAYAVAVIPLSAILSPLLSGSLQGPATNPAAIVPLLATNALWGAAAGLLAAGLQRLRAAER